MNADRSAYVDLVFQTSRDPDAGLPIPEADFDAILNGAGMTRADFADDWRTIRDIREQLAHEPNAPTASERFPVSLNGYKTRVI